MKSIYVYMRCSTNAQTTKSQEADLRLWAKSQTLPVKWLTDKGVSGKSMNRPAWNKVEEAINLGKADTVAIWRLDRLGRNCAGLTALIELMQKRKVNLISLKDGIDLSTPAGRMVANVLSSISHFERELISERISAGQAAARKAGKRWGGSKPGKRKKVSDVQAAAIKDMKAKGVGVSAISRAVGLNRGTVYSVLQE